MAMRTQTTVGMVNLPLTVSVGGMGSQHSINRVLGDGGLENIECQVLAQHAFCGHLAYHMAHSGGSCGNC